jgi:DnaK suppressor protein
MEVTVLEARRMLLRRRRMLVRFRHSLAGGASGAGSHPGGTEGSVDPERVELAQIDDALERIASGAYGSCVRCGGAIGHQRLRAVPETPYCLACRG